MTAAIRSSALVTVVRKAPLRRLTVGHSVSLLALWMYAVCVAVYAFRRGGAEAAGLTYAARILPGALLVSPGAALATRWPRRTVLACADTLRASLVLLTVVAVVLGWPLWAIVIVAGTITATAAVSRPAHQAAIPDLAGDELLVAANAVTSAAENAVMLVAPAIAASLLLIAGPAEGLLAAVGFLGIATFNDLRLPAAPATPAISNTGGTTGAWADALSHPTMRALLMVTAASLIAFGGFNVIVLSLAEQRFGNADAAGYLLAGFGLGGLLGALPATRIVERRPRGAVIGGSAAFAAALALVAAMPTMAGCVLLLGIGGAAATVTEVADGVLTQRLFTGDQLLRVVGVVFSVAWTATAVGALLAPVAIAAVGLTGTLCLLGLLLAASTLPLALTLTRGGRLSAATGR